MESPAKGTKGTLMPICHHLGRVQNFHLFRAVEYYIMQYSMFSWIILIYYSSLIISSYLLLLLTLNRVHTHTQLSIEPFIIHVSMYWCIHVLNEKSSWIPGTDDGVVGHVPTGISKEPWYTGGCHDRKVPRMLKAKMNQCEAELHRSECLEMENPDKQSQRGKIRL